jgi:hypothetical protein
MFDRLRIMRMMANPAKFEMLLNSFAGYILVEDWPKFWEQSKAKSGGGTKGVPWILSTVAVLIKSGIDEKRAWEMPECQAIWYSSAFAMHNGADVAIMTPEEEAFIESQLKQEKAEAPVANPAG